MSGCHGVATNAGHARAGSMMRLHFKGMINAVAALLPLARVSLGHLPRPAALD
jgi:hypothetical protein